MTPPSTPLADILAHSRHLLFDFDGPICDIFSGLPSPIIAAHLRDLVTREGINVTGDAATSADPFNVLRFAATISPDLTQTVAAELRTMESRVIAAVSNNSREAVARYLTAAGLAPMFTAIIGRTDPDPRLLKPDPHLIGQAVRELSAAPADCVLIGDSLSDIEGAHNAGTLSIGYANKPGKLERFTTARADAVITSMAELIPHLTGRQPTTN